jgi:hypothetical protein
VDRARHQLLAGAGLAEHEHGHVERGDEADPIHHRGEARFGADDRIRELFAPES